MPCWMPLDESSGHVPSLRMPDDVEESPPKPNQTVAVLKLLRNSQGTFESIMVGNSMTPTIPNGAQIRIDCGKRENLVVGTVVAYLGDQHPVIGHRIVGIGRGPRARNMVVTRGDAMTLCDTPIGLDLLLGEVTHWLCEGTWRAVPDSRVEHERRRTVGALSTFLTLNALEIHHRAPRHDPRITP